MIIDSMLKDVRKNAGLGDPPVSFYTNVPESANALIKRAVQFRENEMAEMCAKLGRIVKQQREDVQSAIVNRGPYQLDSHFTHLQLTQEKWFGMSVIQRQAYLKKFHNSAATHPTLEPIVSPTALCQLTLTAEEAALSSLPLSLVQRIFTKAEQLLAKEGAIVEAPGNSNACMVESQTTKRPHYVSVDQVTGKVECANCPGWSSSRLCAHSVAVAEKKSILEKYVAWIKRRGGPMNLTALVTFDSSKGVGRKGQKPKTSSRRGGRRRLQKEPPALVIDRIGIQASTMSGHSTSYSDREVSPAGQATRTNSNTNYESRSTRCTSTCTSTAQCPQFISPSSVGLTSIPESSLERIESSSTAPVVLAVSNTPSYFPTSSTAPASARSSENSSLTVNADAVLQTSFPMPPPRSFTPYHGYINPPFGAYFLNLLQCCPPQVRLCYGCGQALKPGGQIGQPPHDIVIVSNTTRTYRDSTGNMKERVGNVYYHVKNSCIKRHQPYFIPALVQVPLTVKLQLTPIHTAFLREFGVLIN